MREDKQRITGCGDAARSVRERMAGLDHEEVWVILLTSDNRIISVEMVSMGTLTQTSVDNRTVIRKALLGNARVIILLHNHPSGNPAPSAGDIRFTSRMREACSLMDMRLLDHIIIAGDSFYSFSEDRTFNY